MTYHPTNILRDNHSFFIPFVIVWTAAFVFAMMHGKAETHMMINAFNHPWADVFFKYFTEVGGVLPWIVIACTLFWRYRVSLFMLASQAAATLMVYPLKRLFAVPRPSVLLSELGCQFHAVEGVSLHSTMSFPSGHTASAFALMLTIAVLCDKNWQKAVCLATACLAGFSRIYLSQHFLQDVLAGSVIGITAVWLTAYWFVGRPWPKSNLITTFAHTGKMRKQ
ncbi:MAG: phosphatase PAP2 family protein [Candidatus Aphodosoma sp.]